MTSATYDMSAAMQGIETCASKTLRVVLQADSMLGWSLRFAGHYSLSEGKHRG